MVNGNLTIIFTRVATEQMQRPGDCNRFLDGMGKISASKEIITRFKSEARFIRAVQYFYLSQYFHDVPLVTQNLK